MMSKELLKALVDVLDDLKLRKNLSDDDALNISDSVLMRAENAIKNYLAQPEQEHLSGKWWYGKGVEDTKYFLKRDPLSDGELPTNNPKINTYGERLAFHTGIRWAEKAHGIGVDDE